MTREELRALEAFDAMRELIPEVERLRACFRAVRRVLEANGCDCERDADAGAPEGQLCLACRVEQAMKGEAS